MNRKTKLINCWHTFKKLSRNTNYILVFTSLSLFFPYVFLNATACWFVSFIWAFFPFDTRDLTQRHITGELHPSPLFILFYFLNFETWSE